MRPSEVNSSGKLQLMRSVNTPTHTVWCMYNLYGVVEHHGSQHSGHYTAYCFNQSAANWFFINDTVVKESPARSVRDANA